MASEYGITVNGDTLELKQDQWEQQGGSYTYKVDGTDLTLEASINVQLTTGG